MDTTTVTKFDLSPLTADTAPADSQPTLAGIKGAFGFVPNLLATLANSPAAVNGYMALAGEYGKGSLSPTHREIVLLAASLENQCGYCTAAHSTLLKGPHRAEAALVAAIRTGEPTGDSQTDALVAFTREAVRNRGAVSAETMQRFLDAGFAKEQGLEVLVGIALKTISNYADHIANIPLDAAFAAER